MIQRRDTYLPERATQAEALRDLLAAVQRDFRDQPTGGVGLGTIATLVQHLQLLDARLTALEARQGRD